MRILLLFCLSLAGLGILQAQDDPKLRCRFLFFDGGGGEPPAPLLNIAKNGTEVTCEVPAGLISPAVDCFPKERVLSFLFAADRKPAATAAVPPGAKAAVLVFVPAAKAADALPWRVFVIDDSPRSFPDGGAFVANFHSQDIRFVIGEHKIVLPPGKSNGFARPTQRDPFNMAPVVFYFQQNDTWRTASESLLRFLPEMRYLIFAYSDPASGRPRIATYQDVAPAPEAPPGR